MGKLSKALGLDMPSDEAPASDAGLSDEGDESDMLEKPKADSGSAEILAMKQFERAADPAAKVQAMKDFLEACGLY